MAEKKKERDEKTPAPQESADLKEMLGEVLGVLKGAKEQTTPQDTDPDQVLEDLEATISELSNRAEEMRKLTGLSKEELERFSENPDNFSKEEWELLTQIKGELRKYEEEAEKIFVQPLLGEAQPTKSEESEKRPKKDPKQKWMRG